MRLQLTRHPDFPCDAVDSIAVEVVRTAGRLDLRYVLVGRLEDLAIPPPAAPKRTDELWRHACFEAFVQPKPGEGYLEFNLAPSTQWAAYRFDGYRAGMRPAEVGDPGVAFRRTPDGCELSAALDLADDRAWQVGLAAVIEERDGRISYWALKHPAGRPDFHAADCFALDLPAPEGA